MNKKWLIAILSVYILIRIYIASLSSYGFYHGWNEAWYSLIAKNYFNGNLWEQIPYQDGNPFSSAPPLFSYAVHGSFKILSISDLSARLVSIFSEIIAVVGVYILAKELYTDKTATIAAIIFIFIPWNVLWFGRVQTDPLMTALMTLGIALYVRAYRNDKSMLPFGITLGLAVFTKQPALAALLVILIWSYFEGIKKEAILRALFYFFVGLIPLLTWLSYYLVIGNTSFITHFIYGELTTRASPFSDLFKVVAVTLVGISPLIFLVFLYEIFKTKDFRKNPLIPWLLIFGIFILLRTPPSHEYYSLPLMPVIAIFAASGILRVTKSQNLILGILLLSTLLFSVFLLSYSGDIGYTATKDASVYFKQMENNPQDTFLVFTPDRYIPQMVWYANLTSPGYSKKQITGISDDLSSISIKDLQNISDKINATSVFLVVDDRQGFKKMMERTYEKVYETEYITNLPNVARFYTGETDSGNYYGQSLSIFKLK
jgi:4-amino-4-deoxy-L-arabinose transferase-like glycosyltransferase